MKQASKISAETMLRETMARETMAHYVSSFCRHATVNSGSSWLLALGGVARLVHPAKPNAGLSGAPAIAGIARNRRHRENPKTHR
jgi:hypothetical protein